MATGSQIGSAVSGAAAGFTYGGPWGAVAGAAVGFLAGDNGADAKVAKIYSDYNSVQQRLAGFANAKAITDIATLNAGLIMQAASFNNTLQQQVDLYNADLQSFLGDYNASLLESEAQKVWEAMDLDLLQMNQVFERDLGSIKVGYGASGVLMNQDSPLLAQIDAKTQFELDKMVVRYNADTNAQRLLDAAAQSRWEGNVAAASILFEGQMNSLANYGNAALNAAGIVAQANIDAGTTIYNSGVAATQTSLAGINAMASWNSTDRQNLISGMWGAASTLGSNYLRTKEINVPASQATLYNTRGAASAYSPVNSKSAPDPYKFQLL